MIPWFLCLLVTQALGDVVLDKRVTESGGCDSSATPKVCNTLEKAFDTLAAGTDVTVLINTPQTLTASTQFKQDFPSTVNAATYYVIGEKGLTIKPIIELDGSALTCASSSVDLKVYSLNVRVTHISSQFLSATAGTIGLHGMDFSVKQTHARLAQPLISATGGVLTVDTCTFTGIKATRGKGTCIYDESNALTVKGTTFTGCYGNTDSAAVYIKIDNTKAFETSIAGTFTGNKAGYSSAVDRDVYVDATGALDKLVQKTSNLGSGTVVIVDNGDVVTATNINTAAGTGASDSPVIVGPTSYKTNCGSQYVPCSTVSDAAGKSALTSITVQFQEDESYTNTHLASGLKDTVESLTVQGPTAAASGATATISAAAFALTSATHKGLTSFTLKTMTFTLGATAVPLVTSNLECDVTLDTIEVKGDTSSASTFASGDSLVSVSSGSLKIAGCHIHGSSANRIIMNDKPLIDITGSDGYAIQFECENTLFAYITAGTNTATVIEGTLKPGRKFSIKTTETNSAYPATFDRASGNSAATSAIVLDASEINTGTNWDHVTFDHVDFGESEYCCMKLTLASTHNLGDRTGTWDILRSQLKYCKVNGVLRVDSLADFPDLFGYDTVTVTSEAADCIFPGTYSVKQFICNTLPDAHAVISDSAIIQDDTVIVASGVTAAALSMNGISVKRRLTGGDSKRSITMNGNLFGTVSNDFSVDHFAFTISTVNDKFCTFDGNTYTFSLSNVDFIGSSSIKLLDSLITVEEASKFALNTVAFSNIKSIANGACLSIDASSVYQVTFTSVTHSECSTDRYGNYIVLTANSELHTWPQDLVATDPTGRDIVYVRTFGKPEYPWYTYHINVDGSTSPCSSYPNCATIAEALLSEQYIEYKYRQVKLPSSVIRTESVDISSASYLLVTTNTPASVNMEVTMDQRKPLFVTGSNTLGVNGLKYSIGVSGSETEIIVKFIDMTAGEAQFTSVEVAGVTGAGESVTIPNDFITIAGGKVTLDTCTFSNLIIKEGYYFLKQTSGTVSIVGSTFSGITMGDKPLMTMTSYNVFNEQASVNTFSSIQRLSGNGAVFEIIDSSVVNHKWSKVKFENCWCGPASKASDYDDENELLFGAVYIYLTGTGLVSFELSAASRCAVNSKPSNIIYLKGSTRSDIKPFQFFPLLRSIKAAPIDESNAVMVEVMGELYSLNELLVSLEVKASSTASEIACDDEVPACGTIAQAISWGSSGMYDKTITVTTPITETIGSTLNYYITIEQDNTARTVTLPASGTLFTVSQANGCDPVINIGTITFSLPASSTCQFAVVNAGSLTITGTKFTSSSTSAMSNSFIDASSGTLALGAGVSFSNIKVESGKPLLKLNPNKHFLASAPSFTGINSVINHQLSAGQVVFQDITLTNCGTANTVNGQGEITAEGTPAICVDITGYTGLSNDVVLFGTVTTTKSPAAALNIEIVCSESQWENVALHIIGSTTTFATSAENQYCLVTIDDNSYTWDKIPTSSPSAYNIKSTGYNIPSCGDTNYECKTIQYLMDDTSVTTITSITLSANPVLADIQATISKATTIQGDTNSISTVSFTIASDVGTVFTVISSIAVTIQFMTFSLTANTNMKLLSNSAGTVTVSNIAVTPTKAVTLSSSLISVSSGSLSMTSVSIGHASNAMTASALLISLPSTAADVNFVAQGCTFTNIVNGSSTNPVLISTSLSAASTFKFENYSTTPCTFAPTATTFAGTYIQLAFSDDAIDTTNVKLTDIAYTHPGSATGKFLKVTGVSAPTAYASGFTLGTAGIANSMYGTATADKEWSTITTVSTATTAYVDADGSDSYSDGTNAICGSTLLKCKSIYQAVTNLGTATAVTVTGTKIDVSATTVTIANANGMTISGSEVTAGSGIYPLTEVDTETYFTVTAAVVATKTVTIKKLLISLKGAGTLLESHAGGDVILETIIVTPTDVITYSSAASLITADAGSLKLTNVNIGAVGTNTITTDTTKALIDVTVNSGSTAIETTIEGCRFENIIAPTSGLAGAVFTVALGATPEFKLLKTGAGTSASPYVYNSFIDCVSTVANGGAFAIDASDVTDWSNFAIDEIRASGCRSNGVGQVGSIKIPAVLSATDSADHNSTIAKVTVLAFKDAYDTTADYTYFTQLVIAETPAITTTVSDMTVAQTDIHYDGSSYLFNSACGALKLPCKSLAYAADGTKPAAGWATVTSIQLAADTYASLTTDLAPATNGYTVVGVGDTTIVTLGDGTGTEPVICHTVGTKTVTLKSHKCEVSNVNAQLATVGNGGKLIMEDINVAYLTTFNSDNVITQSLISVASGGKLSVTGCTFTGLNFVADKGVIDIAVSGTPDLTIAGKLGYAGTFADTFSTLTLLNDGAAVIIDGSSAATSWGSININNVGFTDCKVSDVEHDILLKVKSDDTSLSAISSPWTVTSLSACAITGITSKANLDALWTSPAYNYNLINIDGTKTGCVFAGTATKYDCQTLKLAVDLIATPRWDDTIVRDSQKIITVPTSYTETPAAAITIVSTITIVGDSTTATPKFSLVGNNIEQTSALISIGDSSHTPTVELNTINFELTSYVPKSGYHSNDGEKTLKQSLLALVKGTLTLSTVAITHAALTAETQTASDITKAIITTTAGTLKFNGVTIGGTVALSLTTSAVVIASGVNFESKQCAFANITVTGATSAAISATLSSTSHFYMAAASKPLPLASSRANAGEEKNTLKTVKTADTSGAIYLDMSASGVTASQVTLSSLAFTGCTISDGATARDMFIKVKKSQLSDIITNQDSGNAWAITVVSTSVDDKEKVIVSISDEDPVRTLSLDTFSDTISSGYKVNPSGYNFGHCGGKQPCATVAYAASLAPSSNTVTIKPEYATTYTTPMMTLSLTDSAVDASTTAITITGTAKGTGSDATTYPDVKLTTTCFTMNIDAFELTVSQFNFFVDNAAAVLASVSKGTLTLATVSIYQYTTSELLGAASAAPTGLNYIATISNPLITVSAGGSLVATVTTFSGVTAATGKNIVSATISGSGKIDLGTGSTVPVTFSGCASTAGYLAITATEGSISNVILKDVVIDHSALDTAADTDTNRYIALTVATSQLTAIADTKTTPSWGITGQKTSGTNVSDTGIIATMLSKCPVTGTNIDSGLTLNELWNAQASVPATLYASINGADTSYSADGGTTTTYTCGWSVNPCSTLNTALTLCTGSCTTLNIASSTYTGTLATLSISASKTLTITSLTSTVTVNGDGSTTTAVITTNDASAALTVSSTNFVVTSTTENSGSIQKELKQPLFTATLGTLKLSTVGIKSSKVTGTGIANVPIQSSLITTATGTTLTLESVTIGDGATEPVTMAFTDCSVISVVQGANFECKGSTFQNIKVTDNGATPSAVISAVVQKDTSATHFHISDADYTAPNPLTSRSNTDPSNQFKSIKTSRTGPIYIDIATDNTVEVGQVTLNSIGYTSCQAGTVDRTVYIKAVATQLEPIVILQNGETPWAVDSSKAILEVSSILIPFNALTDTAGSSAFKISPSGSDYTRCGDNMPCAKVSYAAAIPSSKQDNGITVSAVYTNAIYTTTALAVSLGATASAGIIELNAPKLTVQGTAKSNTDVVYPTVALTDKCFEVNNAAVTLEVKNLNFVVVDLSGAATHPSQLGVVTLGTLQLTNLLVRQILSGPLPAEFSGCSVIASITNTLISQPVSADEGGATSSAKGNLEISDCKFMDITSAAAGAVITTGALKSESAVFKISNTVFDICTGAASSGAIVLDCENIKTFDDYISMDHVEFLGCYSGSERQNMLIKFGVLDGTLKAAILATDWGFIEQDLPAWTGKYAMTYKDDASTAHTNPEPFTELIGPVTESVIDFTVATPLARCGGSLNPCNKVQGVVTNYASTLQTITVPVKMNSGGTAAVDWAFADIQLTDTAIGAFKSDLTVTFEQISTTDEETSTTTYSNSGVSATGTLFTWNSKTKLSASHLDVTLSGTDAQVATVTDGSLLLREMSIKQTAAGATATEITNAIHKFEELSYTNALKKSVIEVAGGCDLDLDSTVKFSGIYSAADGGCLNIVYDSSMQNIKADASFSRCMTNGKGGILYLDLSAIPDEVIGEIVFGEGIDRNEQYYAYNGGDCVAFNPSSYTAEALGNTFTTLVNLETKQGQCVFSGNQTDLAIQANSYTVKASGGDETSIANAIDAGQHEDNQFSLYGIKVEADLDIGAFTPTKSVTISGTNTLTLKAGSTVFSITELTQVGIALNVESLTIKRQTDVNYGGLLNMDKASYVTFNKMTYDCSGASKSSTVSAIIASSGVVTVIGSTFKSVTSVKTFINVPLANFYSLLSGTTKNTFDSISSSNTNGTIFNLQQLSSITLENMEFISCKAEEDATVGSGCGGVAYITTSGATTFEFINIAITAGSAKDGDVFFISVNDEKDIKYSDFIDLLSSNNLQASTIKYQKGTDASVAISGRVVPAKIESTAAAPVTLTAALTASTNFTQDAATEVSVSGTFKESADAITLDRSVTISGASASDTTIPFTGKDTAFKISGGKAGKIVTVVLKSITLSYYGSTSSRSNDAAQVGSMVSVAQYTTAELNSITIKPDASHNNIILTSSCITSEGNLILTDMTIQDLTLQDNSLIYIKDVTKDTFKLTNSNTFTNIVKKEGDGAILSVTLATTSELVITNVTFDSCEASNGNGGVLSITQNGGKLTLKSVTFNNCNAKTTTSTYSSTISSTLRTNAEGDDTSSDNTPSTPTSTEKYDTGCGGCMFVSHSADGTHDMSDLTIKGGSASGFGSVLFITGSISSAILKQYKTLLLQAQGSKQCMYFGADKQTQALDLSNLVPSTIYVDPEGTKTETCEKSSESTKACDLLSSAIQSYYGLGKGIHIATGTYEDTAVYGLPLNRQMSIVGESNTTINITATRTSDDVRSVYIVNPSSDATISFESITFNVITPSSSVGSVFSLTSTATLALAYVQLIGDGGLMEDSVIRANAGKVDLTGCTIKSFETYSDALIYSYRPTITLNAGNTFDSISRRSGNGAVFEFEMTKGDSFTLIGSTFAKCASKDGRGGAIYIAYDGGDLVIGDEKETKKDEITTIFEGCSAGSSSASTTRVNSGLTNDDAGKTSEDFEDNLPTSGAGGALYVDIYDIDTNTYNFNITSVKFTDCTATKEGNAVYLRAHTEAGTTMLKDKAFWKTMLKMNKASGDFVYADYTNKSKTAPKSPNLLGLWLGLGLGLGLLAIAGVVITIVCCMRKKKISPSEEKKSTEMSPV